MNSTSTCVGENREDTEKQSAEKFQKFMFDLFEKNGVINDLRAYLRGHIVNIVKSTQSGETLSCQKHFTQRLELTFQAINILIAEYLLRLEFSYTLSVFLSEIPLANMVFSFARMLMETHDHSKLRFKDADVYSILNYIGVKCDSDHAISVVEMYTNNKKTPLLLCILKCLPMWKEPLDNLQDSESSTDSSSDKSLTTKSRHKVRREKCKHYAMCKVCRLRYARLKEKYKRREKEFEQCLHQSSVNPLNVESFMKNITDMEKGLIDELFQQLKLVYEAEMDMIKQEEDKRVKRSIESHTMQLRQKREQLESAFKHREAALVEALQQKKRVLWSVARMLKQQHQHMARAMQGVSSEARDLALKEESLKTQAAEAESILRQRGEDMRKQISTELSLLSNHLQSMKVERDNIDKERLILQNLKQDPSSITPNSDQENLKTHYDSLKEELLILKKYVQTLDSKSVIEQGTMTEGSCSNGLLDNDVILNNRNEVSDDDAPKRLVNDLKKQKNVNFEQRSLQEQSSSNRHVYEYQPRSRSRSRSSSEAGDAPADDELILLQDENRRLKDFAKQQKQHIDSLAWQHARLQAQFSSATSALPPPTQTPNMPRTSNYGLQSCNIAPQTANFNPQPANFGPQTAFFNPQPRSYAALSANFLPQSTNLNAQSARFSPPVTNQFTSQSTHYNPETFIFGTRSAFYAQQSNIAPQTAGFAPQSANFGTIVPQANLNPRPRTSPTPRRPLGYRLQPSTSVANLNVGWRVGAGEELSVFPSAPPRLRAPGDDVPFIGVVGNRHTDNRRYLINQWRSLRRRISPVGGVSKRSTSTKEKPMRPCNVGPTISSPQNESQSNLQPSCSRNDTSGKERDYSQPKSTFGKSVKSEQKNTSRDTLKDEATKSPKALVLEKKSPTAILREAKLRLKKLEIEAEAVEKSYLDFRRKREAIKGERANDVKEAKTSSPGKKSSETCTEETQRAPFTTLDIDNLLSEINTKLNLPSFKNKNLTAYKINPIPQTYSESHDRNTAEVNTDPKNILKENLQEHKIENYLETPLTEFRMFYHSERRLERNERQKSPESKSDSNRDSKKDRLRELKNDKEKELEIFKHNLGKIYNMPEQSIVNFPSELNVSEASDIENNKDENVSELAENQNEIDNVVNSVEDQNKTNEHYIENEENPTEMKEIESYKENLLRIDVESVYEANNLQVNESDAQGFLLFVESSVDNDLSPNPSLPSSASHKISTQMTIVVSPKRSLYGRRSNTGENAIEKAPEMSTDILEPLYNVSTDQISSVQMQLDLSKDALNATLSELDRNEDLDYPDDFSADVDNYNSLSEIRNQSPISLGKISDDDNFWES